MTSTIEPFLRALVEWLAVNHPRFTEKRRQPWAEQFQPLAP